MISKHIFATYAEKIIIVIYLDIVMMLGTVHIETSSTGDRVTLPLE